MRLREWDWDKQAFVEVDYPDAPIAEFINWLRTTKAWHADPEIVHRKLLYLNKGFSEHRQSIVEAQAATARNMAAKAEVDRLLAKRNPARSEEQRARNRENLAKARAAKARKQVALKAAQTLAPDGELPRDF